MWNAEEAHLHEATDKLPDLKIDAHSVNLRQSANFLKSHSSLMKQQRYRISERTKVQKKMAFPKSTLFMQQSFPQEKMTLPCPHCQGNRIVDDNNSVGVLEQNLSSYRFSFESTKMSVHDFEECLRLGFFREGTCFYHPDQKLSCCEVFSYAIQPAQFRMNSQQRAKIQRFHKYLNFGIMQEKESEEEKKRQLKDQADQREFMAVIRVLNTIKSFIEDLFIRKYVKQAKDNCDKDEEAFIEQVVTNAKKFHKVWFDSKDQVFQSNIFMCTITEKINIGESQQVELKEHFGKEVMTMIDLLDAAEAATVKKYIMRVAPSFKKTANVVNIFQEETMANLHRFKTVVIDGSKIDQAQSGIKIKFSERASFSKLLDAEIPYQPVANPKHIYTIDVYKASYREGELMELLARHKGFSAKQSKMTTSTSFFPSLVTSQHHSPSRSPMSVKQSPKGSPTGSPKFGSPFQKLILKEKLRELCNSPLFDPMDIRDSNKSNSPAPADSSNCHGPQKLVSEKKFPGLGSFHMYHRIDDVLVAVTVFDLTETCMNRVYFMSDPAYSFLFLDTVAQVHEIEYFRMLKRNYKHHLDLLFLGKLSINCQKLTQKLNYQPGLVICPRTKLLLNYSTVKDALIKYSRIPILIKQFSMLFVQLNEIPLGFPTKFEIELHSFRKRILQQQVVVAGQRFEMIIDLPIEVKKHCAAVLLRLAEHCGIALCQAFVYEIGEYLEKEERICQSEIKQSKKAILLKMNSSFGSGFKEKYDSPKWKTNMKRRLDRLHLSLDYS